jgi:hypothetical protein
LEEDILIAIMRLKPAESFSLDDISAVINSHSVIWAPVLKSVSSLFVLLQHFPVPWKQAAIVPVFEKSNIALVGNYRHIPVHNDFSKSIWVYNV